MTRLASMIALAFAFAPIALIWALIARPLALAISALWL